MLANTLIVGGAGASANCASPSGEAGLDSVGGGNLSDDASPCGLDMPTDRVNVGDPGLADGLADNGGPTETIALLAGSPAIGEGFVRSCPQRDQRGYSRRSPCDIGAYETVPEPGAAAAGLTGRAGAAAPPRASRAMRVSRVLPLAGVLLLLLASGIAGAQGRPVAKVALSESGAISLDGRPVTLLELREAFRALAAAKGEVWYYRSNPAADPPPGAMAVIQAIAEARLPVRFATKPDFSAFDAPGASQDP